MSEVVSKMPQLRFPEFSDSLIKGALGDYALIKRGAGSQYIEYSKDSKDSIRLIRIGDFLGGDAVFVRLTNAIQRFLLDEGDILIAGTGATAGITFLVPTKFVGMAYSYNAPKIKVHKDNVSFFYQYLISPKIKIQQIRLFTGNAQPFLDTNAIKGFSIFKPPLQEQQKIAAFLSAVDNKIEQLSKKKALLGEYKKGLMQQIFSQAIRFKADDGSDFPDWEEKILGDISTNIMYGIGSAATKYDGVNKYLRITDINDSSRNFVPKPLSSPEGFINDSYKLSDGDIVFARTGASVGKSYLYKTSDGNLIFAGFLIKFNISSADPYFVYSNTFRSVYDNWVSVMSVRSGQPGINAEEYKLLPISLPTKPEQQKIAAFLTAVDNKIEQVGKQLDESKQFKKALLQQMFV